MERGFFASEITRISIARSILTVYCPFCERLPVSISLKLLSCCETSEPIRAVLDLLVGFISVRMLSVNKLSLSDQTDLRYVFACNTLIRISCQIAYIYFGMRG